MRICVLGTSSSAGTGLPKEVAWPWLATAELAAGTGRPVEVEHVTLFPVGARAADFAMSKVEALDPDLVVFAFGSYPCAVRAVAPRIRRRFGERAYRAYTTLEKRANERPGNTLATTSRRHRWTRWLVRRAVGAETIASLDEVAGVLGDVLHRLSHREGTDVLVFSEPDWPAALERDSRDCNKILRALRDRMHEVAREHRYPFVDCTPAFDVPHRDSLYLADAVHKSPAGHRVQADEFKRAVEDYFPELLTPPASSRGAEPVPAS